MSIPNRRRGLVPPPPPQYDPEWENRLRLAMEHVLVPSDFTNSYPFNSPYLSSGRIEVTQISNVTGGPSNVTGDFTKTSPHDEESEVDGSHHWAMRQWRPPSYCGTAYYASPARLPESVSASPNVSGFRLDYDNLAPWSSYDAIADALASTDTKICFQALVGYSAQATLMGGAVSRVDDEMLAETKSYWQMSLADLRDGVASHALSLANYQYVSNNASGSLLPDQGILDVTSPLEAVDNPGAYCTTIRINATAADKYLYSTAADTWAEGSISTYGRSLLDDANASACRDTLGASSGIWGLAVGGTNADLSATGGASQFLRQSSAGAAITVSAIAHADLGSGGGSGTKYLRDDMSWQTVSAGVTDHGALTGLSDDDHSIYALLAGRSGGQTLIGGTAASEDLILQSTSHATRGEIFFGSGALHNYSESLETWGFGVSASNVQRIKAEYAPTTNTAWRCGVFNLSPVYATGGTISTAPAALSSTITITGTDTVTSNCTGINAQATSNKASGTLDTIRGASLVGTSAGAGAVTNVYGCRATISVTGAGNVTTSAIYFTNSPSLTSTGVSTSHHGLYVDDQGHATRITNSWGIRIATQTNSATKSWAFGSEATQDSYFAGSLSLGMTTAAARKLEVRSTSAQIRGSYDATNYWEIAASSVGGLSITAAGSAPYKTNVGGSSSATGAVASAFGYLAVASVDYATALGAGATCSVGTYAIAIGYLATAAGANSITIGANATHAGSSGVTIGFGATCAGNSSITIGHNATCAAANSLSAGYAATCGGVNSLTIGANATHAGSSGITMGYGATCAGAASSAIGYAATCAADYSLSLGYQASCASSTSFAIGVLATAVNANEGVFGSSSYPISNIYAGKGVTNATPTAWTLNGTGGSGTDIAGGPLKIGGGKPSGAGAGGSVILQTAPAGASGTTLRTLVDRLTVDQLGNIYPGTAALATGATDGFIYLQSCAGAPSGTPTTVTGRVPTIVDTTNGRLYAYYGAAWHYLTFT